MVAIIDTGAANLRSITRAVERCGRTVSIVREPSALNVNDVTHVILPGVGHAARVMNMLHEASLTDALKHMQPSIPVLGICLGMQLMVEHTEEGDMRCLGLLPGVVRRLLAGDGVTVPHMGWNVTTGLRGPLFEGIDEGTPFYYVHSFATAVSGIAIATCEHGVPFAAAIGSGLRFGVQFHPEKSGMAGQRILHNFLEL